ncbi:MAG: response regulator [Cytophagaceae bacterium]|nr:response regulator [Gemmatimonadaceae bacterium]
MRPLSVVVVDDEPLAREGLVELLEMLPHVVVTGAFGDAASALTALEAEPPDVLCVDIQMPGIDGFDLVAALDPHRLPAIIFVTAHDAFAVRAFEVNAVDYVLKPVTVERLQQALERVREEREREGVYESRIAALLATLAPERASGAGRLIVREVGQILVVATRDVDWIEGADYYAKLHVGAKVFMMRETLASLEARLDAARFFRIHRSAIVQLSRVRAVESHERGDGVVVLTTGARLKVMRARRELLERRLEELHDAE